MSKRAPNPQRFEVYVELKDGSGFTIKDCDFVFKYDRFGGWYDEFANYYNSNGQPDDPPSDSEDDHHHQSHSQDSYDHEGDEFERQFGGPKTYEEDEEQDIHYEKIASNLSHIHHYPAGKPFRVNFRNIPYTSRKEEVFNHFQKKVDGILNVIFFQNEKRQFNGSGYFVVNDIKAGEDLVRLEGEQYNGRNIQFSVVDVQEVVQDPITKQQITPSFKVYQTNTKPAPQKKLETKIEKTTEIKPQSVNKTQTKVESKVESKVVESPEEFATYKFLRTSFPLKSSFKTWIKENNFNHDEDVLKVDKIEKEPDYALVTMKRKIYQKLNNSQLNGNKITFEAI